MVCHINDICRFNTLEWCLKTCSVPSWSLTSVVLCDTFDPTGEGGTIDVYWSSHPVGRLLLNDKLETFFTPTFSV